MLLAVGASAQHWRVVKTDGSVVDYPAADVIYVTIVPDDNSNHEYVDLGLPSGTLWATCNIGADKPEDYGLYFAWGETAGYKPGNRDFSWLKYKYCNGDVDFGNGKLTKYCTDNSFAANGLADNLTELLPEDDAAYQQWGSDWRMPTTVQFQELINSSYTTTTWTSQNGVNGRLITSKMEGYTDRSLFLPAAGCLYDTSLLNAGSDGYYWSRTLRTNGPSYARILNSYLSNIRTNISGSRREGYSVRPVRVSK